jgi:hypothetical protein
MDESTSPCKNAVTASNWWIFHPRNTALASKWVFKTKANGMRKARLVIKGYRQKHGIDYHETFFEAFGQLHVDGRVYVTV